MWRGSIDMLCHCWQSAPASDDPAGKRVDIHDAADTTAAILNANLDVIMEAIVTTGAPTWESPACVPAVTLLRRRRPSTPIAGEVLRIRAQ